jgi:prepilin-type N-terminal cleavage/methylation domain-containing protein
MLDISQKGSERGLTLIESLAAIVIFGIAITAITPPLMMAMAARVRAHRAEQALQVAQSEIDRVRLLMEKGNSGLPSAEFIDLLPPASGAATPNEVAAPTAVESDCTTLADSTNTACAVDIENDGTDDFVIQTFRTHSCESENSQGERIPLGFRMGVRVYTKSSFDAHSGSLGTKQGSLAFSAATTSGKSPLAVMEIPIVRSDLPLSNAIYTSVINGENCQL